MVAHLWWGGGRAAAAPGHNLLCDVSSSLVRVSYSDLRAEGREESEHKGLRTEEIERTSRHVNAKERESVEKCFRSEGTQEESGPSHDAPPAVVSPIRVLSPASRFNEKLNFSHCGLEAPPHRKKTKQKNRCANSSASRAERAPATRQIKQKKFLKSVESSN